MQTANNIFINPSAILMKIAGKLLDDTEPVSGKTKLLGVKRAQNPRSEVSKTKVYRSNVTRYFYSVAIGTVGAFSKKYRFLYRRDFFWHS